MPIERTPSGATIITGTGDLPEGGMSYYALITAHSAMRIHVDTGGKMRLTRNAGPKNIRRTLNSHYPNRPDGPFKGCTAVVLLREIRAEMQRQIDLADASKENSQVEAMRKILSQGD